MKKTRRHFTDSSNGDDVFNIFSETQAFILVCKSLETSLKEEKKKKKKGLPSVRRDGKGK